MKLKIAVGISLFIFWTAIVAISAIGLTTKNNQSFLKTENNNQAESSNIVSNPSGSSSANSFKLTLAEINKHNNINDCWMIINNKVYDVTSELSNHPGGANTMLLYCGKDGTQGFATKDKSRAQNHSSTASVMLVNYLLGDLNQSVTQIDIQTIQTKTATQQPQLRRWEDDD